MQDVRLDQENRCGKLNLAAAFSTSRYNGCSIIPFAQSPKFSAKEFGTFSMRE